MAERTFDFKKNLPPFLLGLAAGVGLMALEKKFPRAKLQTNPSLPAKLKIADEFLEFTAMRFLDVYSHHWHWSNLPYDEKFDGFGVPIEGAPSGNPHNNPLFGVIAHLGGRPYGYIVEAEREDKKEPYRIAFRHKGSNHFRICSIEVTEPVMLLSGPDNGCIIYALDKHNNPLKLNLLSNLIHRKQKPSNLRIL